MWAMGSAPGAGAEPQGPGKSEMEGSEDGPFRYARSLARDSQLSFPPISGTSGRPQPSPSLIPPRSMTEPFLDTAPQLDATAWVAPTAAVIGDVSLGEGASVWYGASLRGDVQYIRVGARSNVQDNAVLHVTRGTHPCVLGEDVTVGHSAVVHGCTVEDGCLIGMAAVVLDGAVIGAGSIVGAQALVTKDTVVPPRSLVLGSPARVVRALTEEEVAGVRANATHYVRLARMYAGTDRPEQNPFYTR